MIYILNWCAIPERWHGNIHRVGIYSSLEKAEAAALTVGTPHSGTPNWELDIEHQKRWNSKQWITSDPSISYVMWIAKEEIE